MRAKRDRALTAANRTFHSGARHEPGTGTLAALAIAAVVIVAFLGALEAIKRLVLP